MSLKLDNQRLIRLSERKRKMLLIFMSFGIPFAGMLIVIAKLRIMPFGMRTLAISDGMGSLGGLVGFGRALRSHGGFLYGLGGMGGNAWSGLAWGGFVPVRLLGWFSNVNNVPEIFTWAVLINNSLCGLTMYIMLSNLFGHRGSHLIFSTSYAMMGFNAVFFHEFLFSIGPQLLPLVILGLVWLMRGKAPWLYIISLASCIFINAYFGFMLCVTSVIVFIAYNCVAWESTRPRLKRIIGVYTVSSLIAGFLAAFMWLPAIHAYSGREGRLGKIAITGISSDASYPFLRVFSKLFTGATTGEEMMAGLPNIFCGILVVGLVILYFLNKKTDRRKKIAYGAILSFFLLAFYIPALNIFMHGGSEPNGFLYRYSYIFSFFMILTAAEEFQDLREITSGDLKRMAAIMIVGTAIVFIPVYSYISGLAPLFDLFLLAIMGMILYFFHKRPEQMSEDLVAVLLLFVTCINLFANFGICINKMDDKAMNLGQYDAAVMESGGMVAAVKAADKGFYRMEEDFLNNGVVGLDAGLFGYVSVNAFTPAIKQYVHRNLCRLGLSWLNITHWYNAAATAATDALIGLKYIVTDRDLVAEKGYERILRASRFAMFKNANALSVAMLADQKIQDIDLSNNAFENLNRIWKDMADGDEDIFTTIDNVNFSLDYSQDWSFDSEELKELIAENRIAGMTSARVMVSFTAPCDGVAYCYDTDIAGQDLGKNFKSTGCIGVCKKGETISAALELPDDTTSESVFPYCANLVFAVADNERLAEYAQRVQERDISFKIVKGHYLTGEFTAEKGQCVLFSFPWEEGWTAYIDGQPTPIHRTWDLFMSLDVPEGHHTYEMKFFPVWMDCGLWISGAAAFALLLFMVYWYGFRRKKTA